MMPFAPALPSSAGQSHLRCCLESERAPSPGDRGDSPSSSARHPRPVLALGLGQAAYPRAGSAYPRAGSGGGRSRCGRGARAPSRPAAPHWVRMLGPRPSCQPFRCGGDTRGPRSALPRQSDSWGRWRGSLKCHHVVSSASRCFAPCACPCRHAPSSASARHSYSAWRSAADRPEHPGAALRLRLRDHSGHAACSVEWARARRVSAASPRGEYSR